jgi:hypothetical protein
MYRYEHLRIAAGGVRYWTDDNTFVLNNRASAASHAGRRPTAAGKPASAAPRAG